MMFGGALRNQACDLIAACRNRNLLLATAESCTGGLIASLITSIAGSSDVFDSGFVTYSNQAKSAMLGVPAELIATYGAVSEEVAGAMAAGTLINSRAGLAVAVTGIAGPGGGTALKPVGLVHCTVAQRGGPMIHDQLNLGDIGREAIRLATVRRAIEMLYETAALVP